MKNSALKTAIALSLATTLIGACTTTPDNSRYFKKANANNDLVNVSSCDGNNMQVAQYYVNDKGKRAESIKIRVTGYGAPPKTFYPDPQRRLMAMRAAKIDAYRSLAERVTGIQIWGGTTIGDMVVEKDRFRVYLDTHLTGARVLAENPQEDGTYETVVELKVGQDFLSNTLPQKVNMACAPNQKEENPYRLTNSKSAAKERDVDDNLVLSNFYFSKD